MKLRLWPSLWLITPVSLFAQTAPTVTTPPTPTTISVNASQVVQTLDSRFYGINLVIWDSLMTQAPTPTLVDALHQNIFRYPGGSLSDEYNWATHSQTVGTMWSGWPNTIPMFAQFIEQRGAQGIVTVNYGTGTPQMAEALVAYLNATTNAAGIIGVDSQGTDWKSVGYWATLRGAAPLAVDDGYNFLRISHAAPFGVKYWEVGNEIYGSSWETDQHGLAGSGLTGVAHDPYTYAQAFGTFQTAMHAADPSVHIGAVTTEFETDYGIGTHAVTNPSTGKSYTGWTPVMLATMKASKIAPDFLVFHYYPQNPGNENDNGLMQDGPVLKTSAADVRQRLNDYLGTFKASQVELMVTELNSVSSEPGKQAANLVNGLFYADALGSIAQTEFKTAIWWDLHNGVNTDPTNNQSASLYGWRLFGCYDIITGTNFSPSVGDNEPLPVYYGMKLLSHWARGGDRIVATQTNYDWLSAYSAKLVDGTLAILVVNKNPSSDVTAQISLTGYNAPLSSATVYSYGKTNDAENAANPDLSTTTFTGASTNFNYTFPSYSMTVIRLSQPPTAPSITTQPASTAVPLGNTATFSVAADGTGPFTYQWFKDGVAISGATAATLNVANVQPSDFGAYTVTLTNGVGTQTSQAATLGQSTAHLSNVSMRVLQASGGENTPIIGLILSGSGTAPILVRALGPALIKQGLTASQVLADPAFSFYSGQTLLTQNDNWDPAAATQMAAFSASPIDANSLDAAIVQPLGPGGYTALLQPKGNAQGIGLLEMYSLENQTAQLRNISGRALVGTGDNVLIAGFIINGSGSVNVLVRGLGPSLAAHGVTSPLADPTIDVYAGQTQIATNDDWASDPNSANTVSAMAKTGAPALMDREAALTLTLTAGVPYTVIVSGFGGTTGVGSAEIFQVP